MPAYKYSPLNGDEIRLLELHPGEFDDDLSFDIIHERLLPHPDGSGHSRLPKHELKKTLSGDWEPYETPEGRYFFWTDSGNHLQYQHPDPDFDGNLDPPAAHGVHGLSNSSSYEALSYCWGSMDTNLVAHVCRAGTTCQSQYAGTLQLGNELGVALRHLRHRDRPRTLWVDAICINQADMGERGHQVTRMGMIYSQAQRVIAWLGLEANNSSQALKTLSFLGQQVEISDDNWRFPTYVVPREEHDWFDSKEALPYNEDTWQSLVMLLQRPYFERLWIKQEIRLANPNAVLRCGEDEISFHHFRRGIDVLSVKAGVPYQLRKLVLFVKDLTHPNRRLTLGQLLSSSRTRKCSDMHDKVYAILNLAPPAVARSIKPEYARPVEEVFKDVFALNLQSINRLDLLHFCGTSKTNLCKPSWVPDFSSTPVSSIATFTYAQAAGCSRSHCRFTAPETLEVIGVQCMSVDKVSAPLPKDHATLVSFLQACQPPEILDRKYATGQDLLEAWIRLLLLDQMSGRYPYMSAYFPLEHLKTICMEGLTSRGCIPDSDILYAWLERSLDNVSLVDTNDSFFGWAPAVTQVGDRVAVILGCRAPMVLRPQENGKFSIVGACYVQGLMDGEALLGNLPHPWSAQYDLSEGHWTPTYLNSDTGAVSVEDPRLCPLIEWERLDVEIGPDDPEFAAHFRHKLTGETMNSDPRMLPQALEERGVQLQKIRLV